MKKIIISSLFIIAFFLFTSPTFAATPIDPCPKSQTGPNITDFNPLCALSLEGGIVGALITIAFIIATLVALAFLIWGGIKWITSGGDKTAVEGARNTIVAAIVGLVIVFLSYFILRLVFDFFNVRFNNLRVPSITSVSQKECIGGTGVCGSGSNNKDRQCCKGYYCTQPSGVGTCQKR